MTSLTDIAPEFVDMAHAIVWASAATVDADGKPRSRVLHPIWEWDGAGASEAKGEKGLLVGWIATVPTPVKVAHLAAHPEISLNYWAPTHDTCSAECVTEWVSDDATRLQVWDKFLHGPEPVGYDPAIIPMWSDGPQSEQFAVLKLQPYRLRVMRGTVMTKGEGAPLNWRA